MSSKKPKQSSNASMSHVSRPPMVTTIIISVAIALLALGVVRWNKPGPDQLCINGKPVPGLLDATTDELVAGLEKKLFTSVDLVRTYIERIQEVNSTLRAVVEINPDALSIAAKLDEERANGIIRRYGLLLGACGCRLIFASHLHGLPYLIKNNMATDDKMETTCEEPTGTNAYHVNRLLAGSYALFGSKSGRDAGVVTKLRAAGVVILGKTNLSQWSNFRSIFGTSSNGWSALGGQVIGPYYPQQDPSGSSSGSGVAAALGLAVAALGTETDGSILYPSSASNIVGIKPTVGLTSRSLLIPISEHQDTVGPMARTVRDAAHLLQAIVGYDKFDSYTSLIPFKEVPDYVEACDAHALNGAKIGIPRNMITPREGGTAVLASFQKAIAVIREAGAAVFDETNVTTFARDELLNTDYYGQLLRADFFTNLSQYLSGLKVNPNNITSLEQLRSFTHNCDLECYPDRSTAQWDRAIEQSLRNNDADFQPLLERSLRAGGVDGVLGVLRNHSLDALVLPTHYATSLSARIGAPVVSVPMGFYPPNQVAVPSQRGLVEVAPDIPFGISFLGAKWSEAKLISYAYAFEQRTRVRTKASPHILPTTELAKPCSV